MTRSGTTPPPRVFVARRPILDRHRALAGYELLFRPSPDAEETAQPTDRDWARVISEGLVTIGLEELTSGHRAFITVGRWLLTQGVPAVLPPDRVVLQLAPDIEADAEVVAACRDLRNAGYSIAIDDFSANAWTMDLVALADFLKVPVTAPPESDPTAARLGLSGRAPALIAKHVDTSARYDDAMARGFEYFQGEFFGKPRVAEARALPGHQLGNLRLLQALHKPELSVHQLENLIKHDTALVYRILRTVNSAAYAHQTEIDSIREALVLLGRDTVRRWASLWALADLNTAVHPEMVAMSTVRGRSAELLAGSLGSEDEAAAAFLAGMCSLLDVMLDRPMRVILDELPLPEQARSALLGFDNFTRRVLDCVIAYERGDWDRSIELARRADVKLTLLPLAYAEALRWSRELGKEN